MILAVANAIYKQLRTKPEKKIQDFHGIWTCDLVERDMSSDLFHGNMN